MLSATQQVVRRERLLSLVERFAGTPITVLGDLILDAYIFGRVNRISPEAPVVVVDVLEESKRPGGAGNVASNLAALGAKVSLLGIVGDDASGSNLLSLLAQGGTDVRGVLRDPSRPTSVKTRIIAHSQQVVRVDREVTTPIAGAQTRDLLTLLEAAIPETKGIIISDYGKGTLSAEIFERIAAWRKAGKIGLQSVPLLVDPKPLNFRLYQGSPVIKPNRKEAEEAAGMTIASQDDAIRAGRMLLDSWGCEMVLITLGEDGMVLVGRTGEEGSAVKIDTVAREVYDVSGAGDTTSAVFTLALAVGGAPEDAAYLANIAAGIVVGEVGTVAVGLDELRRELMMRDDEG